MMGSVKGIAYDKILRIAKSRDAIVHFVGVGGVSMYSLAMMTVRLGASVTGSDRENGERLKRLSEVGVRISVGHSADNVREAALVVYTSAVSGQNPELLAAKNLGILTVSRAEYMGALMIDYKKKIGVSGTHGKSTTVAMLDKIFSLAGVNPTVLAGAELYSGEAFRFGSESVMIYEACEYRDSFLRFSPTVFLATNLEYDHADYFENLDALKESFVKAMNKATELVILNGDDENLISLRDKIRGRVVTYGQGEGCDYRYRITSFLKCGFVFTVERFGNTLLSLALPVPGVFNVSNAAAAVVCAIEYGLDAESAECGIAEFRGLSRRLELVGHHCTRAVYYDYAHHPTEIRAAIHALKLYTHGELTVVFRPHTYSRTKSLWEEFRSALSLADFLVLCEVYAAREEPIEGVSSSRLAMEIGDSAVFLPSEDVVKYIDSRTSGAIVLMGAGDLSEIKDALLGEKCK